MKIRYTIFSLFMAVALPSVADDWMGHLPDDRPMCELSIPGTHDAATGKGFLPADTLLGNLIGRTQELGIDRQWSAGIRAFDLRPAVMTDSEGRQTLHVYHGEFATQYSFGDVLSLLRDSLRAHPSECAVIVMRHESSPSRDECRWAVIMDSCLKANADVLADFRPGITLGQMRGRILLLSRDNYAPVPYGGYIKGWVHVADLNSQRGAYIYGPSSEGDCPLWVQDFYDTSVADGLAVKTKAIARMAYAAVRMRPLMGHRYTWVINHTSGYSLTAKGYGDEPVSLTEGYRANAATTNKTMLGILADKQYDGPVGIIVMDFGGTDRSGSYDVSGLRLVNAVISHNFANDVKK